MTPLPGQRAFVRAAAQVRAVSVRRDLAVREIDAPTGLAPHALALAAEVRPDDQDTPSPYGSGRFVLLHDDDEPDGWEGAWRIVTFAQAPLEPEIAADAMLAEVAWSWLTDALDAHHAAYRAAAGTATRTLSQGFGTLEERPAGAEIEVRASWSPTGDMAAHVRAWADLVCMLAGLPPGSEDAALLAERKDARD